MQILVLTPPGELAELVIGRATKHDCIAIGEMLGQASKLSDFGWADECEILRVKEDDFPFSGETPLSQRLEGALPVLLLQVKAGLHAVMSKGGNLLPIPGILSSQHRVTRKQRSATGKASDMPPDLTAITHHAGRGTFAFDDGGVLEPHLHRVVSSLSRAYGPAFPVPRSFARHS